MMSHKQVNSPDGLQKYSVCFDSQEEQCCPITRMHQCPITWMWVCVAWNLSANIYRNVASVHQSRNKWVSKRRKLSGTSPQFLQGESEALLVKESNVISFSETLFHWAPQVSMAASGSMLMRAKVTPQRTYTGHLYISGGTVKNKSPALSSLRGFFIVHSACLNDLTGLRSA